MPQLEKAHTQQGRASEAKNDSLNKYTHKKCDNLTLKITTKKFFNQTYKIGLT